MSVSPQEREFVEWWLRNRDRRKKLLFSLWVGLPLGTIFAVPVFINFLVGRFWYKRADAVGTAQFNPFLLVVAVILIAGFTGFMHSRMRWEKHDEQYRKIMNRLRKEEENSTES